MEIWVLLLLLFGYCLFEFINSIFFNWQLFLLTEKKYISAGIFSAFSTLMLISSFIISVYFSVGDGSSPIWWFIPMSAISMGIGNFLAAILVPKFRKFLENKKNNKNEIK